MIAHMGNVEKLAKNYLCCVASSRPMSEEDRLRVYLRARAELSRMEDSGRDLPVAELTCKGKAEFGLYGAREVSGSACSNER